ncbi:MAG: HEAT repeat domain-containing protein [Planctomycetes bacterium]|nr:HEAT repeat domain-containing protein [Planctomycetota bacterium]
MAPRGGLLLAAILAIVSALAAAQPEAGTEDPARQIERLADPDPAVWQAAARALARAGLEAESALLGALGAERPLAVRARAARILGDRGARAAAPQFLAWLADPGTDPTLRREAARAAGRLRLGEARDPLVGLLADDPEIAAEALAELGDDVVVPDLLARLLEPLDGRGQVAVGVALCRLGARAGVDLLLSAAFRPEGDEVLAAIDGLRRCLAPALEVPERVVPDRSAVYALQLRWNRECASMPLPVGPSEPSAALCARLDRLASEVGSASSPAARRRRHVVLVGARAPAARALVRLHARDLAPPAREEACRILVDLGPYAVAPLLEALHSERPGIVRGALHALGRLAVQGRRFPALEALLAGAEGDVLALLESGCAADPATRRELVDALGWIGGEAAGCALAPIAANRQGEPPEVRLQAVRSLGLAGAVAARERLERIAEDAGESDAMRIEAAFAGALVGNPRAIGILIDLLAEGKPAVEALRRLSGWTYFGHELDPAAAVVRWQRWWERYAAVIRVKPDQVKRELLWERENEVYRRELEEEWLGGLAGGKRWIDRVDQEARCLPVAIRMLPTLRRAVRESPDRWIRFHAVQMMAILGERAAVPALVGALQDPEAMVRSTAAEGLGLIGRDFAYEDYSAALRTALVPRLADPDPYTRLQAALALARLRYADGIPALIDALEHPSPAVVDFAWTTLRRVMGGRDFGFRPAGALAERRRAVSALRAWWAEAGKDFRPELPAAR